MQRRRWVAPWALVLVPLVGCGGESADPRQADAGPSGCASAEREVAGHCIAAGVQDDGCDAGQIREADGCRPAGIPAAMCGAGFASDGAGACVALLPSAACTTGTSAVPGETVCHEIAPCGTAKWGDAPIDAGAQYVDVAYAGGASDGTSARPWTTIQEAIDAAATGVQVVVAAGTYTGTVDITGKPVRVLGRCPALVEIVGDADPAAVLIQDGADGAEIRSLAIRGSAAGLLLSGSKDVVVDRVWIHDTAGRGVNLQDSLGPTSAALSRSLVERASEVGVFIAGATASVDATEVRDTQPKAVTATSGRGLDVVNDPSTGARSAVTVRGSLVSHNRYGGIDVVGSDATIETTVVRQTQPRASDQTGGRGVDVVADAPSAQASSVVIRTSVVSDNRDVGIYVSGSDATIEATVVARTQSAADGTSGEGIVVQDDPDFARRPTGQVRSSVVDANHDLGVLVSGADVEIESTLIARTEPQVADMKYGLGLVVQDHPETGERANAEVRACTVEHNHQLGILVNGADAKIDGTLVRATAPQVSDQLFGRGVGVQWNPLSGAAATAEVHASVVDANVEVGICVVSASTTIDSTVVRGTTARALDGLLGDGVAALEQMGPANTAVVGCRLEENARAGVSSFGASVNLSSNVIQCNSIDLDGEMGSSLEYTFDDGGGNVCGCGEGAAPCELATSKLAPPDAVTQ